MFNNEYITEKIRITISDLNEAQHQLRRMDAWIESGTPRDDLKERIQHASRQLDIISDHMDARERAEQSETPSQAIFDEQGRFIRDLRTPHIFDLHFAPERNRIMTSMEIRRAMESTLRKYNFIDDAFVRDSSTSIRFTREAENVEYVHDPYTVNWMADENRPVDERIFSFVTEPSQEVVTAQYQSQEQIKQYECHRCAPGSEYPVTPEQSSADYTLCQDCLEEERANSENGNDALIEGIEAERTIELFPIGSRVRIISPSFVDPTIQNESGEVVAVGSKGNELMILLDRDKGKAQDKLTLAYWVFHTEIEDEHKN